MTGVRLSTAAGVMAVAGFGYIVNDTWPLDSEWVQIYPSWPTSIREGCCDVDSGCRRLSRRRRGSCRQTGVVWLGP